MHRFYIRPENWDPDSPILIEAEAHHARHVLRLKAGEKAVLFNGRGRALTAEAIEVGRQQIRFRKLHETETPPLRCRITLGQAIPKGKNMDLIVQKAVELGAAGIAPLISERTIVHLSPNDAVQKQAKWQQIAIEAAKQCGQNWLPEISLPQTLREFLHVDRFDANPLPLRNPQSAIRNSVSDLRLIASLQSDAQPLKKILANDRAETAAAEGGTRRAGSSENNRPNDRRPTNVVILIGPEGDFAPAELALAKTHGCQPVTLGPIILRVETAAIYCLSILSYELL